ncbi:MAG: hypothetical protein CM15mP118_0110 [Alphaproteobacteria bacterium]|nr:MAG: hypothetical protein CM15mP118_0110 [Alphaproteobacteria bacterium]
MQREKSYTVRKFYIAFKEIFFLVGMGMEQGSRKKKRKGKKILVEVDKRYFRPRS